MLFLFRKERYISESGSAPVHRWKGGEARIQLGPLELVRTTGQRKPHSPEEENRASKYCVFFEVADSVKIADVWYFVLSFSFWDRFAYSLLVFPVGLHFVCSKPF
jgi:hypothetical protein